MAAAGIPALQVAFVRPPIGSHQLQSLFQKICGSPGKAFARLHGVFDDANVVASFCQLNELLGTPFAEEKHQPMSAQGLFL